ncbi:MAG: S1C family serine protease [Tumebacillaceae bacterium]
MKKGNHKARVPKKSIRSAAGRRTPVLATANIADIVERYKDAVVNLEVVKKEKSSSSSRESRTPWDAHNNAQEREAPKSVANIGTGFFFDTRGYILTNEHVIHGADEIYVRFFDKDEGVPAKVVGESYELDLAVLKVNPPPGCKTLPFGISDEVRVGDWVIAIGCPLGLDHSVTIGIVSATERPITIGDRHYPVLLQTDAAINRGNSGGPLINLRGQVVGMNTAVSASSQGIGFAIPVDVVRNAISKLMASVPKKKKRSIRK